jgi:hypothetical protein
VVGRPVHWAGPFRSLIFDYWGGMNRQLRVRKEGHKARRLLEVTFRSAQRCLAAAAGFARRGSMTLSAEDEPAEVIMARAAGRTSVGSGASRARTGDLLGAIQALSQLSYSPAVGEV